MCMSSVWDCVSTKKMKIDPKKMSSRSIKKCEVSTVWSGWCSSVPESWCSSERSFNSVKKQLWKCGQSMHFPTVVSKLYCNNIIYRRHSALHTALLLQLSLQLQPRRFSHFFKPDGKMWHSTNKHTLQLLINQKVFSHMVKRHVMEDSGLCCSRVRCDGRRREQWEAGIGRKQQTRLTKTQRNSWIIRWEVDSAVKPQMEMRSKWTQGLCQMDSSLLKTKGTKNSKGGKREQEGNIRHRTVTVFPLEFFSGPVVPNEKTLNRRDTKYSNYKHLHKKSL